MTRHMRVILSLICVLILSACTLPRGAALQSEILAQDEDASAQFAVYPVTHNFLAQSANWPKLGPVRNWIHHTHASGAQNIRANDIVDIVVWDSDDNSLLTPSGANMVSLPGLKVGTDGAIFLPYLGRVKISGLSPEQARSRLQSVAEQTIPSAQIQLNVKSGTQRMVSLVGGVTSPGQFPIEDDHFTIQNLISQGGGVAPTLRNPQVMLTRDGKPYQISLSQLYEKPHLDTIVKGGDKVVIREEERYFRVMGATSGNNIYYFEKEDVSALDALAMIGKFSETRANLQGILILREYNTRHIRSNGTGPSHSRSVFVIDMTTADGAFSANNFEIMSKDTILVTESPVTSARTILSIIGSVFGLSNAVSN